MSRIFNYQDLLSGTNIYFTSNVEKFGFVNGEKFSFIKYKINKSPPICSYTLKKIYLK